MPDYPLDHELIRFFEQTKETFGPKFYENCLSGDNVDSNTKSIWSDQLSEFGESISSCQECQLGKHRNKFVFGIGDLHADLMFIGEAPGKDEDLKGEPFVGKAGKLLDKILSAINMNRHENVYICNVLKCRPPQNRDPLPEEVEKCEPYLIHQIKLIRPQLIVALGRIAATTLLRIDGNLKSMRGKLHDYHGTPLRVTYHPAALLRNPDFKRPTWEDFQFIRDFIQN
ncbi:MAG: uracil-DNA glycosylase [Candidatus Marinimicrobia bacterium]|nr:uracil-DNA glycosylase [Candidatus Neomarinimicrobiota bacterium]